MALLFAFFIPFIAEAQEATGQSQTGEAGPISGRLPPGFMDSTAIDSLGSMDTRVKSPGGAVLRALALPGWGQFYTGHPIRGALAGVCETAFFAGAVIKYRDCNRLRDDLRELEKTAASDDPLRVELNERIKSKRRQGGDYLAYGLTTLLLNLIDSYVSAHLYRFDRNFQVQANPRAVQLCYRF